MLYQLSYLGLLTGDEADPKHGSYRGAIARWQALVNVNNSRQLVRFVAVGFVTVGDALRFLVVLSSWDCICAGKPFPKVNVGAAF
jgi:hypothetical protein